MPVENNRSEVSSENYNNFLKPSDFENLNLPEILPIYRGKGKTSFAAEKDGENYDSQKMEYLEEVGINIPDEWKLSSEKILPEKRALFVSTFIVTGHVLVMESIRRALQDSQDFSKRFELLLDQCNGRIEQHRLDEAGMRVGVLEGKLVESFYDEFGLSANPEKRVSRDELFSIVQYIFSSLKKENN